MSKKPLPNILHTVYIIIVTMAIVLPLGIGAAIYLTEYATNQRLVAAIEYATETLAGIPETMPVPEMVNAVLKMVTESIDSFVRQDVKTTISVIEYDDVVDNYFNACKSALIRLIQGQAVSSEAAVDLLLIAKYYERIGDHAVNIAKRLLFAITGSHERHDPEEGQ